MTALESQGVELYIDEGASPFTLVGELVSFSGPDGQASVIDVTNLSSTARQKLMGVSDEGQISLELNLDPGNSGQDALRSQRDARTANNYSLNLNDASGTILTFSAFCLQFALSGGVDEKLSLSCTLEIDGAVTWA